MNKPDLFASEKKAWIAKARKVAEKIALEKGSVDIEQVLQVCPRPGYMHPGTTGKIFSNSVFKYLRVRKSTRPISKGRLICVWRLDETLYPNTVLFQPTRERVAEEVY
jgi:hypothetical protein